MKYGKWTVFRKKMVCPFPFFAENGQFCERPFRHSLSGRARDTCEAMARSRVHMCARLPNTVWVQKHKDGLWVEDHNFGVNTISKRDMGHLIAKTTHDVQDELENIKQIFMKRHPTDLRVYENDPTKRTWARLDAYRNFLLNSRNSVYVWKYSYDSVHKPSQAFYTVPCRMYEQIVTNPMSPEERIRTLVRASYGWAPGVIRSCEVCLRMHTCVSHECGLCTTCFDRVARTIADEREELVQREFSGILAGIVDKEGHDEMVAKHMAARREFELSERNALFSGGGHSGATKRHDFFVDHKKQ
jgi:hypothetical protein